MTPSRRILVRLLATVAALSSAWAATMWLKGGVLFTIAGVKVSSNSIWRPLAIGVLASGVVLALQGAGETIASLHRLAARVTPRGTAIALALATTAMALWFGSWTASGPDPFAYVSQAALWRNGHLEIPVPLAGEVPWPNAIETFVPFGYRAAPGGAPAVVPITAPGVPMLMALLQSVAGHAAAFVVTPIAGGILVLVTFAIGRRVRSPAAGLAAAWFVATSPAVLFMLMWPMSDIPAAACTAVMVWLLLGRSTSSAAAAGLAASAGLLTRPNFVTIVIGALAWLVIEQRIWLSGRGRWRRTGAFALALIPGAVVMAGVNMRLFGSALASGYGTAGGLLSFDHIALNAFRYGRWLAATSPLAFVGLAALFAPTARIWTGGDGRRAAWLLLLVSGAAVSVYFVYGQFDDWWYLRFLLPAWPAMFVATAVVIDAVSQHGRIAARAAMTIVLAAGVLGVSVARSRGVFIIGAGERRYATIAALVRNNTEPAAVILTTQHIGTVRYYAGRETVRFDVLDPAWLDRAVEWLSAHGRHPYFLVEDWEQAQFETRFARTNALGRLSFSPALAWQSAETQGWVLLYDPLRRDAATVQPGPNVERAQPFSAEPVDFPSRSR